MTTHDSSQTRAIRLLSIKRLLPSMKSLVANTTEAGNDIIEPSQVARAAGVRAGATTVQVVFIGNNAETRSKA